MRSQRLGFGFCLALAMASVSSASTALTLTFLDTTDTVQWSVNGGGPLSCGSNIPEFCSIQSRFVGGVFSQVALFFNIYEPDGVTLSDTLQVIAQAGSDTITSTFQSDVDGVPLVPFAGGTTIMEDGSVQTAATVPVGGVFAGSDYVVDFQSDIDEAATPEPRLLVLLSLGMLAIAFAARRRKLS